MKITELFEDGRIVKGVNTTVDVGVNEIPRQAAKYGNRVTKDGFPPVLDPSGKVPRVVESAYIANLSPKMIRSISLSEGVYYGRDILTEQQIYEGFMSSAAQFLGKAFGNKVTDIKGAIADMKTAGILIKDIVSDPNKLEITVAQLGKQIRNVLKTLKQGVAQIAEKFGNNAITQKINAVWAFLQKQVQNFAGATGWKGFLSRLGIYGFLFYVKEQIFNLTNIADTVKSGVFDTITDKVSELGSMLSNITMPAFLGFFGQLVTVKKYFFDILTYIKTKIDSVRVAPTESISSLELALLEGGHTVEESRYNFLKEIADIELNEGWKERMAMAAKAGVLGATALGGIATKGEYDKWVASQNRAPTTISQPTAPDKKPDISLSAPAAKAPVVTPTTKPALSKLAPTTSIRPKPRPADLVDEPVRPKPRPDFEFKDMGTYASYMEKEARKAGIKGEELIALMAQTGHETAGFESLVEDGDSEYFKMYDPEHAPNKAAELGNTEPGDGARYKGRGFIHLTGKYNYAEAGKYFGLPLVENPKLAATPGIAAKIAVWFWLNKVRPNVTDFSDVESVTEPINPKLKGLSDRKQRFEYLSLAFAKELKTADK